MKSSYRYLSIAAVSFTFHSVSLTATSASSCYYPSGNLAPSNDIPCDTSTDGHSACCSTGVACLSSGLCFDNGLISRGSCTDSSYADEACTSYCTDYTPSSGAPVVLAEWAASGNVANMGWCCGFLQDNGTCPQGAAIKVAAGTVYTTAGASATSTSSSAASTGAGSSSVSATATPTQDALNANASSSSNSTKEETCEKNNDVAIGAGVGVPLVLAALACLFLWLRERKLRRSERLEGDLQKGIRGGYGEYQGSHAATMVVVNDRKTPMEMGDGRRPEELP